MTAPTKGYEVWRTDGKNHRIDGPAVIYDDGTKIWYINGKKHRLDGPAIEWSNGYRAWFVDGRRVPNRKRFQEKSGISDEDMAFLILKYGDIEC